MFLPDYEEADGFASRMIPFVKYTSCGNNFVIVDATEDSPATDLEWSQFAAHATSTNFGIGCDNLLIIQRSTTKTIDAIIENRNYWDTRPDLSAADFIFRMFEPNGDEAACCGNGLICIADFLRQKYGICSARIATEIPLNKPNIVSIGSYDRDSSWVNLGFPRKTPTKLFPPHHGTLVGDNIDVIEELTITFRNDDLKAYTDNPSLTLKGYLVFTGEPHLVVFPDHDFSNPTLANLIFGSTLNGKQSEDNRMGIGSWLVHRIGSFINKRCRTLFPEGISVNFTRVNNIDAVQNRCFERGINRETLACSTGALAVAYMVQQLFDLEINNINLLPLRCRDEHKDALIRIQQTEAGWCLTTTPYKLFEGHYQMPPINIKTPPLNDYLIIEASSNLGGQKMTLESPQVTPMRKSLLRNQ